MRPVIRFAICALVCASAGGCYTQEMWQSATATTVEPRSFEGFVADSSGKGVKGLIFEYEPETFNRSLFSSNVDVFVPTDEDGVQIRTPRRPSLTQTDYNTARHLRRSSAFTTAHPGDGSRWGISAISFCNDDATCTASIHALTSKNGQPKSQDVTLLRSQPRPLGDILFDLTTATVFTPVTLAADVVMDPAGIVVFVFFYKE